MTENTEQTTQNGAYRPWVDSCHEVTLTIDGSGVDVEWTCSATEGAWCRMTCPEGCEEWFEDHEHALVDAGECVVLPWLENDAWDEGYSGPPQQLRCGPIFVQWDSPGYRWSYDPFANAPSDLNTPTSGKAGSTSSEELPNG